MQTWDAYNITLNYRHSSFKSCAENTKGMSRLPAKSHDMKLEYYHTLIKNTLDSKAKGGAIWIPKQGTLNCLKMWQPPIYFESKLIFTHHKDISNEFYSLNFLNLVLSS